MISDIICIAPARVKPLFMAHSRYNEAYLLRNVFLRTVVTYTCTCFSHRCGLIMGC